MIAVLFKADALPEAQERYLQLASELKPLLSHSPGIISIERYAEHLRSLARAKVAIDDVLKGFEAVDFFHGEHPGVMYSHRKLLIRKKRVELGIRLFERTKRRVVLSECGAVFLQDAQKVIRDIEKATDTARRAAKGLLGKITIAYVDAAPFSLLSPLVMQFRHSRPDVGLVLHEMASVEQFEALQNGQIDIGLLRPLHTETGIDIATLLKEPYVVAMHKAHALAEHDEVPIRALAGEKFLFTSKAKAQYIFSNWNAIFTRYGMQPQIVQEVNQLHAMLSLIGTGMGIALLPLSVAENNNHGVVYRTISGIEPPQAELSIAWRRDRVSLPVSHFINTAKEVGARWGKF